MGVSLFSHVASRGAGTLAKTLALGMLRAERQRGIAQLGSRSLRVHTRMGALRVLGPAPIAHEEASTSFVYEVDLSDRRTWAEALAGRAPRDGTAFRLDDHAALSAVLDRARGGERVEVVSPGLSDDGEAVYLRVGQ